MKSVFVATILSLFGVAGAASAATVDTVQMVQNDWIVFDFAPENGEFLVSPGTTDGSFSYSYGFSETVCPQSWACMPDYRAFNTVYSNGGGDFGYGWAPQSLGGVVEEWILQAPENSRFLFFRVTSGSASVASVSSSTPPAAVPLPASAVLLLGGLGGTRRPAFAPAALKRTGGADRLAGTRSVRDCSDALARPGRAGYARLASTAHPRRRESPCPDPTSRRRRPRTRWTST